MNQEEQKLLKPTFFNKKDENNPKNDDLKELEKKPETDKGINLLKPTFFSDSDDLNPKKKVYDEKDISLTNKEELAVALLSFLKGFTASGIATLITSDVLNEGITTSSTEIFASIGLVIASVLYPINKYTFICNKKRRYVDDNDEQKKLSINKNSKKHG